MIYFISVCELSFLMQSYRNVNIIKGITAGLILLVGLAFFLLYFRGSIDINSTNLWIFVAVVGGVITLALSGIFLIPRTRIRRGPSSTYGVRESENYKDFEKVAVKHIEKDFQPSKKLINSTTGEAEFCDYCGIILEENLIYCSNCGNKIKR